MPAYALTIILTDSGVPERAVLTTEGLQDLPDGTVELDLHDPLRRRKAHRAANVLESLTCSAPAPPPPVLRVVEPSPDEAEPV